VNAASAVTANTAPRIVMSVFFHCMG
jgi:hypothetical protein